jgi:hypothetical protein
MFSPFFTELGPTNEYTTFSYTITYEDGLLMSATVVITSLQPSEDPDSIVIAGNTISGYFYDSFDKTLTYRTPDNKFIIVDKFTEIDKNNLSEMISYHPSLDFSKTFFYRADAYVGDNIIDTKTYTIEVVQDWTSGMESLKEYVNASSKSYR